MRYPDFLPQGAPSASWPPPLAISRPYHTAFCAALDRLEGEGYGIDLGPNCFAGDGIGISSTPANCGRELTDYYCSDRNDAPDLLRRGES